jgi:hypothetical protein
LSFYLALPATCSFSHACGIYFRGNREKGLHFKVHKDANEAYVVQYNLAKQAKAALAKLDGTTREGTGSSRKSSKKHKETAATASQPDSDLQAEYVSEI